MAGWFASADSHPAKAETLGLHKTRSGGVAPGNFIGIVRVGDCVLRVDSKFPEMDGLAMFLRCADHPRVGEHMKECLTFWPEQPPIETDHAPDFCGLVAAAFLRELNELCARRLRRNFLRESENLTGKMKGKILTMENIRRNLARGRADRAFCAYQSVSDDILENRILRAALERTAMFLSRRSLFADADGVLERWVRASRSALRGVSVARVRTGDFSAARVRGAFSHYRKPLHLARAVLESTGFELGDEGRECSAVVPFALNSAELFERWAELKLLESGQFSEVRAGYARGNTFSREDGRINVRPDFWVPARDGEEGWILDAKYARPPEDGKPSRENVFQMVAYSRHRRFVEERLGAKSEDSVSLGLLYPEVGEGGVEMLGADDSFYARLSWWAVSCPVKAGREGAALAA